METMHKSNILDESLAPSGVLKMDWAWQHMPVMSKLREKLRKERPLEGERVAIALHLEAKTACLGELMFDAGAQVAMTGSNPLSTQDDVCAALVSKGITVNARYNPPPAEYKQHLINTLETRPTLIIDDGSELIALLHSERTDLLPGIKGGCEETTTGILRLHALEKSGKLQFPMFAVNDAQSKFLFDNRYGTGQSVWDGINRTTNLVVAGKTVVVVGYGWCGRGVAMRARGLGAKVIVTEIDSIKATEAYMDGFVVMPILEAVREGDIFVTTTGNKNVISKETYSVMKDGAILSNAGHFNVEIDVDALEALSVGHREVRKDIMEYEMSDGRKIYLLAEGRLVNLAAGDGHPAEIMDMTFALQSLCLLHVHQNHANLKPVVMTVPYHLDEQVSRQFLEANNVKIDSLTDDQSQYLDSWQLH